MRKQRAILKASLVFARFWNCEGGNHRLRWLCRTSTDWIWESQILRAASLREGKNTLQQVLFYAVCADGESGFAKRRPAAQRSAAYGPRRPSGPAVPRPSGPRPTAHDGPAARWSRPVQSWFSTVFFCPALNPRACTDLHRVWACKMDDGEFEFVYHFKNHFQSFSILSVLACCWVKNVVILCLFVCLQNPIERNSILKRCKLFSDHSLRLKIS